MGNKARKFLSRVDEGGRIVVLRSDGMPFNAEDKKWFDAIVTRALRQDNLIQRDLELAESDVHPTMLKLRSILNKQSFTYGSLSVIMGKRKSAISEWLRGNSFPFYHEAYRLFSMLGYRLHPVPTEVEAEVLDLIKQGEQQREDKMAQINMGGDDSVGSVRSRQGDE